MNYRADREQHFRLIVLKALAEQNDYQSNDAVLQGIAATFGISETRDFTKAQLRFLEDAGAATISEHGTVLIARVTDRGLDHVQGRTVIDGVKRPTPGG